MMLRIIVLASSVAIAGGAAHAATSTYWNLFNIEGESQAPAAFVTYATLADMLGDTNRTGAFQPLGFGDGSAARNVVGSGASIIPPPIPLPASAVMLVSALAALAGLRRRRGRASAATT
jgi:hypothetical protein